MEEKMRNEEQVIYNFDSETEQGREESDNEPQKLMKKINFDLDHPSHQKKEETKKRMKKNNVGF